MTKNYLLFAFFLSFTLFFIGCEVGNDNPGSDNDSTKTITLNGSVVDAYSGDGIANATIKISDGVSVKGTTTNETGGFSTTFPASNDLDLTIIVMKEGYFSDTTAVFAIVNKITKIPIFQLVANGNSNGGAGFSGAASINFSSQSATSIGVKESGALESAEIIFEVRDSSGTLINESNAVELSFSFGATPGGGEYLYPASAKTNALGKATVTLNTGTIAGVVQVIAETTLNGKVIRSKPILISIHGGFPTQDLFYIACKKLNYPFLGIIGNPIVFTAYSGDKYNNPVRPGTSIYFTANFGIIGGSNITNEAGTASVTLLTEPYPNDPVYGAGFFTVKASTGTEDENTIFTSTVRLLSGHPIINVNPSTFNISNGGSQTFTYIVADINGNPMSEGQSIKVSIESEHYEVVGDTEVKMPDTQSKSWTSFSFTTYDTQPDSIKSEQISIEISTTGPNSDLKTTITGFGI